jgi:hypothetical protein
MNEEKLDVTKFEWQPPILTLMEVVEIDNSSQTYNQNDGINVYS